MSRFNLLAMFNARAPMWRRLRVARAALRSGAFALPGNRYAPSPLAARVRVADDTCVRRTYALGWTAAQVALRDRAARVQRRADALARRRRMP